MDISSYSTNQIAQALGLTYEGVRRRLTHVVGSQRVMYGRLTRMFRVQELPHEYQRELSKITKHHGYKDIESLLEQGKSSDVVPTSALAHARSQDLDEAAQLMRAFQRALELNGRASAWEQMETALDDYQREFKIRLSERTIRRKLDEVIKRDGGREDWKRLELYLSERALSWMEKAEVKAEVKTMQEVCMPPAANLQEAYAAVEKPSEPTEIERALIWDCAFQEFEAAQLNGQTTRQSRAFFLTAMQRSPVRLCATREAYAKAWQRNYRRWVEGGRKSIALNDARHQNPGRMPLVTLTPQEVNAVKSIAVKVDTNLSDRSSRSLPIRLFAESEACRPELAQIIHQDRASKHTLTPKLRQQVRLTPEEKMFARGPRTLRNHGYKQLRDNSFIDENGNRQPLLPGMLFESDDMHINEPFYVPWPEERSSDKCVQKHAVRLVRAQLLPVFDVASRRFLSIGFALRPNDAYRATDILWTFSNVFREIGIPTEGLRFEQSIWKAKTVKQALERCAPIYTAYSAGSKIIENRFGMLQKVLSPLGLSVGRGRHDVWEEVNKRWLDVRAGRVHPREAGFLSFEQIKANLRKAMAFMNADKMEGQVKGAPDDIWTAHFQENPPLAKPTEEQLWHLQPERKESAIRDGIVKITSREHEAGYQFHSSFFAKLGRGYKVDVCFDPVKYTDGAYILNAEKRERAFLKQDGVTSYKVGELLCWAECVERSPQFSKSIPDLESYQRRSEFNAGVRHQSIRYFEPIEPYGRKSLANQRAASVEVNRGLGEVHRVTMNADGSMDRQQVGEDWKEDRQAINELRQIEGNREEKVYKLRPIKNPRKRLAAVKELDEYMEKQRAAYAAEEEQEMAK